MARFLFLRQPSWWTARSLRERRLLLVMAALLALLLIWLAVIRPLMDARAAAEAQLTAAVTELAEVRAEAAMRKQQAAGAAAAAVPLPLDAFLSQSAGEQGFTSLNVVAAASNRATINIAQVRPTAFFGWIGQLEARGLAVESLSARANADQTIAVEAVLQAGGS